MKLFDLRETISQALAALRANRLRAFLTLLGVVIGVFSFIGVMTGISVLQETIESGFNFLGSNTLLVQKYPAMQHGPGTRAQYRNRKDITYEHGMYVRENSRLAEFVNVEMGDGGAVIQFGNRKTNPSVMIIGGTPEVMHTRNKNMELGRMFTEEEMHLAKNVVVIGDDVARMLFPNADPVGKTIRVNSRPMRVIGVIEKAGGAFGAGQDNFVFMPVTTFRNDYGRSRWVTIQAKSSDQSEYDAMTDEIIGLLRTVRGVAPGEENDFEIMSNESLISSVNDMTYLIRVGTGAISAIALLAAGIGIMNIMLVSVTERTREIGIRKALGAQKRTILWQFLVEAVFICQLGGIIGVLLGLLGGNIVALLLDIPVVFPLGWALLGMFVTTLIGVVFGVYPAWKASNLDPIEALRYE